MYRPGTFGCGDGDDGGDGDGDGAAAAASAAVRLGWCMQACSGECYFLNDFISTAATSAGA